MNPDLTRLIRLQELDNAAESARRGIEGAPGQRAALASRLADAGAALTEAQQRLAACQTARREVEKDLAAVQTRLSRYKDQLMEVKTNKEYQAMQKEIAVAEREVRGFEDRILELMLQGDELQAGVKAAEAALAADEEAVAAEQRALDTHVAALEARLAEVAAERAQVAGKVGAPALALFDHVSRQRRGVAVAEAREGHCTFCHVRLRPQVFNEVRRSEELIQCESCLRILYFVPRPVETQQPTGSERRSG